MEEKNEGRHLPIIRESQDIFQKFDDLDDEVILAEIENRVVDNWVYHFKPTDAPEVWGIGKAGIDGCVSELGMKGIALREEGIEFQIDPTNSQYVLFTAKVSKHIIDQAGKEAMLQSAIGTKRQWTKLMPKGGDKPVENKFWFEQGSMKAIRNAKARLIPEEIKAKIIAFAKEKGKVKEVKLPEKKNDKIFYEVNGKRFYFSSREIAESHLEEAKDKLGNEIFWAILGREGFSKFEEIPDDKIGKIYEIMMKEKKADKE